MSGLIQRVVAALATFGSFIALVPSLKDANEPLTAVEVVLITLAAVGFLATVGFEVHDYRSVRPKTMRNEREIRNYMYKWINHGGRVAVFSRSLGWVNDEEMREMMTKKAKAGELTLVMPAPVAEAKALVDAGAEPIYYGADGYTIRSRFTIIHRERSDTAVAIGRTERPGRHIITEFKSSSGDPAFWLAQDLIEILKTRESDPNAVRRA
jgi:hypothetical protein